MDGEDLFIGELQIEYALEKHSDVPTIRSRFDRLALDMVDECARQVRTLPYSTIVIDHVDLEITADARDTDGAISRQWGRAMAAAIWKAMGSQQAGIARFRDEVEYFATFLDWVVRGGTRSDWRYRPLAHLFRANPGDTIVASLREAGVPPGRVLHRLHEQGRLENVLAALTDSQTITAAGCLVPEHVPIVWSEDVVDALASLLPRIWPALDRPLVCARNWIRCLIWLVSEHEEWVDNPAPGYLAAEALRLLAEIERGDEVTLDRESSAEQPTDPIPGLNFSASIPSLLRQRLARHITAKMPGSPRSGGQSKSDHLPEPIMTSVGGLFLLIRELVESTIPSRLAALPATEAIPPDKLGYYVLALSLAGPSLPQARYDRGAAVFAGLEKSPSPIVLQHATSRITPAMLIDRDPPSDFSGMIVPHKDSGVLVVQDANRNWRFAAEVEHRASAEDALQLAEQLLGAPVRREPWAGEPIVQRDVSHLFAAPIPGLTAPVQASFTVLARRLLAKFARRLSGFEGSSVPYLITNFLSGPSTIELNNDTVHVRLPRTPLQIVLRLYGTGEVSSVPWLDGLRLIFSFA